MFYYWRCNIVVHSKHWWVCLLTLIQTIHQFCFKPAYFSHCIRAIVLESAELSVQLDLWDFKAVFFFSALLPGSTQIANSYLPPQARLRLQTVCLWLVFKLGCNIWRPGISIIIINYSSSSSRGNNTWELRHREKYEKDIYWQNCPQKPEKWLQTSETKVRRAGAGEEVVETSAPWKIHWIHFWLMPIDSHQEIMAIKKLFKT